MVAVPLRDMDGQMADHLRQNAAGGQPAFFRADPGSVLLSVADLRAMNRRPAAAGPPQDSLASALKFLAGSGA